MEYFYFSQAVLVVSHQFPQTSPTASPLLEAMGLTWGQLWLQVPETLSQSSLKQKEMYFTQRKKSAGGWFRGWLIQEGSVSFCLFALLSLLSH